MWIDICSYEVESEFIISSLYCLDGAFMRIVEFIQTPFITHDEKNQIRIKIADWDYCNPFRITISAQGAVLYEASVFQDTFTVLIPTPIKEYDCTVIVAPFEDSPVIYTYRLRPPKRWRIGLVYSSHEDIGYCGWVNKLEYESYQYLLEAMRLCEEYDGFKYVIEHVWWLEAFQRYASTDDCDRLRCLFEKQKIELNAIHCGYHTHWAEAEQLICGIQFASQDAASVWNIIPKTAVFTDISGASWQTVSAYAGQGIRYVGFLENGGFRKPDHSGNPPPVFRWMAQNGRDSVLGWYQTSYRGQLGRIWCDTMRQYPEGTFFFDESKALKTEAVLSKLLNDLESAPYDILPYSFYDDRERPTKMLLTVCEYMNRKWKYPHFSLELPTVMFSEIEKQSIDKLPVVSGDIIDQWGDFATISPEWMSMKRRAMRQMISAEAFSALAAINGKPYDAEAFRRVVRYGCLFDEHCWATSSKHPQKMHRFNLAFTKKHSAELALELVEEKLKTAIGMPGEVIGLYNTLPASRQNPVRLPLDVIPEGIAVQNVGNSIITEPLSFSPMGMMKFSKRSLPIPESKAAPFTFETDFYRVAADPLTKRISSIFDKIQGKELLDQNSDFALGDYIYTVTESKTGADFSYELSKCRGFFVEEGDVAFVITRKGFEEQSGADVQSQFIFYKHAPSIDVELSFSNAIGLMGDFYDRYKKNIFFAFPFNVEKHQFYTQLAGGRAHSVSEKAQMCPMDFTISEEWIAVEGEEWGIGIRSEDMPVFHLSQINFNRFLSAPDFPKSHIYLYAASNRTNNLNFCTPEDAHGTYHLTILPYNGHCEDVLPHWSRCLAQPVLSGDGREPTQLCVDAPLRLMCCRVDTESSLLLRFAEESGVERKNVKLTLPFAPTRAVQTTLDGKEIESLEVNGSSVLFSIQKGGYISIRVYGNFTVTFENTENEPIYDIFSVPVENSRSIVCFTKSNGLKASKFQIFGDGALLAEKENSPEYIQTVEVDARPKNIVIEVV